MLACPYTSHQNGKVERKYQQIIEMGQTLIALTSLPMKVWDHIFITVVCLINMLLISTLSGNNTSFNALHKKHHDYNNLSIFGCACFPHLRPYRQHKLDFRSDKFIYFGISPTHKGHKCMDKIWKIYVSKDVTFNDFEFSYPQLHNGASLPTRSTPHTQYAPLHITSNTRVSRSNQSHQVMSDEVGPKTHIEGIPNHMIPLCSVFLTLQFKENRIIQIC